MSLWDIKKYDGLRSIMTLLIFGALFTCQEVFAQPIIYGTHSAASIFSKTRFLFNSVAWSPDGETIAVAGSPRGVVLYNSDFMELFQFENTSSVTKNLSWTPLVWSPDGSRLASIGLDGLYI